MSHHALDTHRSHRHSPYPDLVECIIVHPPSIEKKTQTTRRQPHLVAVRLLKLTYFRGLSDSVVYFIWILPHHFDFYHIFVLTVYSLEWTIRLMHLKIFWPHFDLASIETEFAFMQPAARVHTSQLSLKLIIWIDCYCRCSMHCIYRELARGGGGCTGWREGGIAN